ncbi:MAG: flagellar biosynthesis protein FlhF, partial [Lachnospiraceae bacterium]|nr:flagellar biosynthesis protein FlhF [Lachnospiraceae bacterium]
MIIKKFQGKTETEAVENAKKELGSNVVIMNVRNVKKKGVFGFLMPQLTEVTVALEEESERLSAPKKEQPKPQSQHYVEAISGADPGRTARETTPLRGNSVYVTEVPEDDRKDNNAIEEKLDTLHTLLEQQLQKPEEAKEELDEQPETEIERFMKLLYNTMLDNEVDEQYANQIIDEFEKINKPNMPFDHVLSNIYQKMVLKFGMPSGITPAEKGPKLVFFVGPTGVGKTTTIAKIASKFSVEGKKKLALLTADTYRIAAAEQLRTYANILEVPFRVIYTEEDMELALQEFWDYDYIMVDTAGHSHQNDAQREAMKEFIHSMDGKAEKEVFLVLSSTIKYRDLVNIADAYSEMTEYKIIFTKLDETTTLGNLLNLKLYTGASLSY